MAKLLAVILCTAWATAFAALKRLPYGRTPEGVAKRLRIRNACPSEPVWIAHMAGRGRGPDLQNVKIEANAMWDFVTPFNLSSTRYWPKYRCDSQGTHCLIGESGGEGQECGEGGCAPPVDTKFEATFGSGHCDVTKQNGCDWVDVSLVDGFTVPFKLSIQGRCYNGSGVLLEEEQHEIDCMKLDLQDCPMMDKVNSKWVDLRAAKDGKVLGCYSPCSKMTLRQWNNQEAEGRAPTDEDLLPYCCPTPPVSPKQCRAGPIRSTAYVQTVKELCPNVYGFAYDDGMGLLRCESDTRYFFEVGCPKTAEVGIDASIFTDTGGIMKKFQLRRPWQLPPLPAVTVKGCDVGSRATCPDGGLCSAESPCCSDGSLCPSWGSLEDPSCPHPKKLNCVKNQFKEVGGLCDAGDFVPCPDLSFGIQYHCSGDECCPDGSACPSASRQNLGNCSKRSSCVPEGRIFT